MVFYSSISCRQRFVSVRIRFDLVPRQTDNTPEHIAFRTFLRKIEKIKETENNWIKLQQKLLVGITIGYLFEIDWHTCLVSSQEKTNLNVYGKRSTKKNQPQSTVDTPKSRQLQPQSKIQHTQCQKMTFLNLIPGDSMNLAKVKSPTLFNPKLLDSQDDTAPLQRLCHSVSLPACRLLA